MHNTLFRAPLPCALDAHSLPAAPLLGALGVCASARLCVPSMVTTPAHDSSFPPSRPHARTQPPVPGARFPFRARTSSLLRPAPPRLPRPSTAPPQLPPALPRPPPKFSNAHANARPPAPSAALNPAAPRPPSPLSSLLTLKQHYLVLRARLPNAHANL
ncbi:hypothetical protein B0H15DRAFT_949672 [Mycena belliarum]|uniref:Uncharacterized protein n=1 Tax=Mycena belliarum TaxID=1033014 RepID=A0AAD6XQX9_9AGAR|nr:hypothetical protein B0H15DRAFT_949672 [Mycena belliae]